MKSTAFSRAELVRQASLTAKDLTRARQCRRDFNQLGFGYQIGFVRLFNRFPAQDPFEIHDELLKFTAAQLIIDAERIDEYAARQATVSQHQARVREYLELKNYGGKEATKLGDFLFSEASRLEQTAALHARAREFLKDQGILLPADYALNRLVGEQRKLAREHIYEKLSATLAGEVSERVDELLTVETSGKVSELQQIKANPSKPSPEAMVTLLQKLQIIEATGVIGLDLSWLNGNYQRALFHYVRKCSVHRLRELSASRRKASLVCFLWQSYRDAIDQSVDMFGKLLTRIEGQAERELDEQMRDQRKAIKSSLSTLKTVGEIVLDESVDDEAVRERIFSELSREELNAQLTSISQWISGRKSDVFYGVLRRFSYLRRIDQERDYGALGSLVSRADQTLETGTIAEQWDRMGQFYASLERGHTTASVALKRLVSYSAKNRFYRANRDLGRVLKTEFILSYMSQPQLRARIRRGLLKVEQLHALARDVYYGRRGRVNARELHEQMNSCSCLTLILACINYWQAREISKAVRENDPAKAGVDVAMLEHISPIEWENVILYGQYVIDRRLIRRSKRR